MGHDKKMIETLYNNAKSVKAISEQIPSIIDRLDQKKKIHDMAAKILINIEKLEEQQKDILNSAARENKDVLSALQKGIQDNSEII